MRSKTTGAHFINTPVVAPEVTDLELRRMEKEAFERLRSFGDLMSGTPSEARTVLQTLLTDRLVLTPIATEEGKRYEIRGTTVIGSLFGVEAGRADPALSGQDHQKIVRSALTGRRQT